MEREQSHDLYSQGYLTQRVQPFNPSPFDTYNGSVYRPAPTYQAPNYGGGSRRGYGRRDLWLVKERKLKASRVHDRLQN